MFVLGHLGIGSFAAARRVSAAGLPWLLLGCVLPDLIDKPLFHGLELAAGHTVGIVTGTRTFGHTLLAVVVLFAVLPRRIGAPLALGMLTHLALDGLGDLVSWIFPPPDADPRSPTMLHAIFFPLLGVQFPMAPFHSLAGHLATLARGRVLIGELVGGALLIWQWRAGVFVPPLRRKRPSTERGEARG